MKDIDTLEKEDCQAQDITKKTMEGYFSMSLNLKYKKVYILNYKKCVG